jgi:hypothetical protein
MKRPSYVRLLLLFFMSSLIAACGGGDATPNDPLCTEASDASDGVCYLRTLVNGRLKVVGNAQGKIFFSAEADAFMLYAFDLKTQHFIGRTAMKGYTPTVYAYSPEHGRIYVGDTNGGIHAYSEDLVERSTVFAKLPLKVAGLVATGKYLMAQDASGAWATHYLFDKDGKLTQSKDWNYYSSTYEWAAATSRVYFFRDGTSPNDLMFEEIDQASGLIKSAGETPYHGDYSIQGPIRANLAGTKVLLGSGDIYAAPALTWSAKLTTTIADAMWLANDELLVTSPDAKGTRLQRYSSSRIKVEELTIDGEVLALAQEGSNTFLIVRKTEYVEIVPYTPSDDSDGDGVSNLEDKFPLDKTAAVDSDNDGYPDAWLKGYTAADSTTGLTLDAYPLDASCHAPEQGDGVHCDPALAAPPSAPDRVFSDDQGTVFLFSAAQGRLYRWSDALGGYLPPLVVGQRAGAGLVAPISLAYSAQHQRIYLGYESGQITRIDLVGDNTEKPFAAAAASVQGLAAVGKYLLAQDNSGAWATHSIFDQAGQLTDHKDWNYFSRYYDWAPNQSRVYFFRDGTSPNDLLYEEIDQSTGRITASGDSPYHGTYNILGPIRVSLGGGRIILGTGDVYSALDLTVVNSLGQSFQDMQWLSSGALLAISPTASGDTRVMAYSPALALQQAITLSGAPLSLTRLSSGVVVFTLVDGKPQFTRLSLPLSPPVVPTPVPTPTPVASSAAP